MSFLADSFFFKASSNPTIRSIGLCVNLKHGFDFNNRLEALTNSHVLIKVWAQSCQTAIAIAQAFFARSKKIKNLCPKGHDEQKTKCVFFS